MIRLELAAYLTDTYGSEGEHLFAKDPGFLVNMRYELTK